MTTNIPALRHTFLPGYCTRISVLTSTMSLLYLIVTGKISTEPELELLLNALTTNRGQLCVDDQLAADEMHQWFTYARDKCAIVMHTTRVEYAYG